MDWMELLIGWCRAVVMPRATLVTENLALRQQLYVLKRNKPRPRLNRRDRMFWIILFRLWNDWRSALVIVEPDTVRRWHRAGFRLFWRWKSQHGRPCKDREIRALIRRLARDNPLWGLP